MKMRATRPRQNPFSGTTDFAKRLLAEWKKLQLPGANESVVVAVSGGADSSTLLLALDELLKAKKLSLKLVVAHLDHGLRKASKEDAEWVSQLSKDLGYFLVVGRANVKRRAATAADNLEQAGRRARYEFLKKTANIEKSNLVLTAHTLDDQAETILLRLLRGSAAEGLSGTESVRALDADSKIQLARPLLSWARRSETEAYCRARKIHFRVDEMNEDERLARVKIRKQLLPLMQSFNNRIVETLARTATLLREDAAALSDEASKLLERASETSPEQDHETNVPLLSVAVLAGAPAAIRRRALRRWISLGRGDLRRLEMVHLLAVERLLEGSRGGRVVELPDGTRVGRKQAWLTCQSKQVEKRRTAL
jgi:tRNA(Ile)-lysidine synthase